MLTLIPTKWYSWDFRVLEDGQDVSLIDRDWFRERASFSLAGTCYSLRRTNVLRGTFVLERGEALLCEARKPSSLRRRFEILWASHRYSLEPATILGREFHLREGGVSVGVIRRVRWFRRTATARFDARIPREVQLFISFLVLVLWKRAADAAAAGG